MHECMLSFLDTKRAVYLPILVPSLSQNIITVAFCKTVLWTHGLSFDWHTDDARCQWLKLLCATKVWLLALQGPRHQFYIYPRAVTWL